MHPALLGTGCSLATWQICCRIQQVLFNAIWPIDSNAQDTKCPLFPSDSSSSSGFACIQKFGVFCFRLQNEMYRSSSISQAYRAAFPECHFRMWKLDSLSSPTHSSSLITFIHQKAQGEIWMFSDAINSYNPAGEFPLAASKKASLAWSQFPPMN